MSKLDGHSAMTSQAINEIVNLNKSHPLAGNLHQISVHHNVVLRDIFDIFSLGHWADFGQKHHFMRQFDGQSPYAAYEEGVEWVRSNALQTAKLIARRIQKHTGNARPSCIAPHSGVRVTCNLPVHTNGNNAFAGGRKVLGGYYYDVNAGSIEKDSINWQPFGNALHSLQDSFARGHAVRDMSVSETTPGAIEHIKIYAGEEVKGHSNFDKLWGNSTFKTFTPVGRLAIEASKELILIILRSAQTGYSGAVPNQLTGWTYFVDKWLVASVKLSTKRDFAIDFIERFDANIQMGNMNLTTLNMDEEALADALISECSTNLQHVYEVIKRLDEHYNTDSDDVATLYVDRLKLPQNRAISMNVATNEPLRKLLIKVMTEGYTAGGESDNIEYLNSLKSCVI